ncbi:MAG: LysR family transcriptional regulator, partial [Kiloniellales bacterium]|nr:LysR family transcriptional regulator [Kiloniellales bacterium]
MPPLNALRAFEAAARHLSFTKAAQELHVTQAAISHQVKGLEEILGIQLFRRLNRRLALTEAGQDYLPPLRDAFDAIAGATQRLHEREEGSALKISVLLSFASAWLLPRLSAFRRLHPEIDILVTASDTLVDFEQDDFDMGIRYGLGSYPGLRVDVLMEDEIYPVCSPKLLDGPHPLRRPADLKHHTLLHDTVQGTPDDPDWRLWLRQA